MIFNTLNNTLTSNNYLPLNIFKKTYEAKQLSLPKNFTYFKQQSFYLHFLVEKERLTKIVKFFKVENSILLVYWVTKIRIYVCCNFLIFFRSFITFFLCRWLVKATGKVEGSWLWKVMGWKPLKKKNYLSLIKIGVFSLWMVGIYRYLYLHQG